MRFVFLWISLFPRGFGFRKPALLPALLIPEIILGRLATAGEGVLVGNQERIRLCLVQT